MTDYVCTWNWNMSNVERSMWTMWYISFLFHSKKKMGKTISNEPRVHGRLSFSKLIIGGTGLKKKLYSSRRKYCVSRDSVMAIASRLGLSKTICFRQAQLHEHLNDVLMWSTRRYSVKRSLINKVPSAKSLQDKYKIYFCD